MDTTFETFRAEMTERLIEAARIDWALPATKTRPAAVRGFWPVVTTTHHDDDAWKRGEESGRPKAATAAEATRWAECMAWVGTHVTRSQDRRALWAWCRCKVGGPSLAAWSRREGLGNNTAHRRAEKALTDIAAAMIGNNAVALRKSGDFDGVTNPPEFGTNIAALTETRPPMAPTFFREPGAKPTAHDAADPEAQRNVIRALERANRRARAVQAKRAEAA